MFVPAVRQYMMPCACLADGSALPSRWAVGTVQKVTILRVFVKAGLARAPLISSKVSRREWRSELHGHGVPGPQGEYGISS